MEENYKKSDQRKLYDTLKEDISEGGFSSNISNDFEDLKEYFLNEERKKRLAGMGKFKRFFYMAWWLLSELLLKLTPTRRLVLVIGILLLILPGKFGVDSFSTNTSLFGGIFILFVLMLELKDKLVAKDELGEGRSVQKALMSDISPVVPGWKIWLFTQPANDVGGDLVDIIKLGEGKYGVTIADVSGKGLGAALLMAKLQTIIRALTPEYTSISKLFNKLNYAFHKDILPNSFASMIYVEIFENKDNLNFVNAGHLPPVIIRNREIIELAKGDVALGLAGNSKFKSNKNKLSDGDYFVGFSDGVTEARDISGKFYGVKKLLEFIRNSTYNSPGELGQKILTDVEKFIGAAKTHDDLSIVILKRENH
jgi:serine phosphatase RsbU (regulator of sigma subunit)